MPGPIHDRPPPIQHHRLIIHNQNLEHGCHLPVLIYPTASGDFISQLIITTGKIKSQSISSTSRHS
ncbi:hypothetical protein BN871_FJ_00170 [Paenibacillus sp. P22]|nr:hypothetical protein BN871_FJ_00170 [Paenibacillus sp. P22]